MEASAAGLGQGDAGQGNQGVNEGQGAQLQAVPGLDPAAINETLQQLGQGQEGMREILQSLVGGQQQQEQVQDDGLGDFNLDFLDPATPGFDPTTVGQQLQQLISSQAEAKAQQLIQQHVNPLESRLGEFERSQQVTALAEEFPELQEPENAKQVVGLAAQVVQAYSWPKELAGDPRLWRVLYLAGRATDAHNEEEAQGGEQPGAAFLEGGRGARPAGVPQGQDLGDLITGAGGRRGAGALPF